MSKFRDYLNEDTQKDYWWNLFQKGSNTEVKEVGNKIYDFIQSSDKTIKISGNDAKNIYSFLMSNDAKIESKAKKYFNSVLSDITKNGYFSIKKDK